MIFFRDFSSHFDPFNLFIQVPYIFRINFYSFIGSGQLKSVIIYVNVEYVLAPAYFYDFGMFSLVVLIVIEAIEIIGRGHLLLQEVIILVLSV